jgi:hypothetical protein
MHSGAVASRREPRRTAAYVEQAMIQNRTEEEYRNSLTRYNHDLSILSHTAKHEQRLAGQRRMNEVARCEAEEAMEARLMLEEARARAAAREQEQNAQFSDAIQRKRAEKARREIEIQRICAGSEELKQLEQRLKVAYINKERAEQQEQKHVLRAMEEDIEQAIIDAMEHDRQEAMRAEERARSMRHDDSAVQRMALEKQMAEKQALLEEAAAEEMKDKAMVDEIVARIDLEEEEEMRNYAKKVRRCILPYGCVNDHYHLTWVASRTLPFILTA